ncbi:cytochrome c oxidase polypeptide I [Gracilibacillus boraciitolerans JCM 21714]|uniref:Cytochrome c oxidase polypeptide I n=1 Tax=Gracilibacillus boraciitolerans JCM 21714 TaxID=1298598 RepID=W4VG28_9BACI|nr:cytochrome c oxidase polypeptide I [Gracilibacillus boraciitolerans JCM 21714]
MPRRYWTYLEGQGLDLGNMISTIGAFLMGLGTIVLLINIVKTSIKNEKVGGADPWDARTLEWAISSPPPFYNFKQLPLVRGLDPLWIEKTEGRKGMTPAEPLTDIHMPNNSFLPFIMAFGMFIAGFGFIYQKVDSVWLTLVFIGMGITLGGAMLTRSVKDDLGYHIHKEDLKKEAGENE